MRISRLLQVRQCELCAKVSAASVNLLHKIISLHFQRLDPAQVYSACVIDQNVDAAEFLKGLLDRRRDLLLETNVAGDWQSLAARRVDFRRRRENRSGEFCLGCRAFGGDRNIRSVAGGPQTNGEANAAARAGDEQRLARQRFAHNSPIYFVERCAALDKT